MEGEDKVTIEKVHEEHIQINCTAQKIQINKEHLFFLQCSDLCTAYIEKQVI
jgi:hypothetical protein